MILPQRIQRTKVKWGTQQNYIIRHLFHWFLFTDDCTFFRIGNNYLATCLIDRRLYWSVDREPIAGFVCRAAPRKYGDVGERQVSRRWGCRQYRGQFRQYPRDARSARLSGRYFRSVELREGLRAECGVRLREVLRRRCCYQWGADTRRWQHDRVSFSGFENPLDNLSISRSRFPIISLALTLL